MPKIFSATRYQKYVSQQHELIKNEAEKFNISLYTFET